MYAFLLSSFVAALAVMLVAWLISRKLGRIDIVDAFWGLSFIGGVVGMRIYHPESSLLIWLVDVLVTIWGLRLASNIFQRFRRSQRQDERYTQLMQKWPKGNRSLQAFGRIFVTQAVLATAVSLPVIVLHRYGVKESTFAAGLIVWLIGFIWESVADRQLAHFARQPANKGKLMTSGLWRYSRHPNYFGEVAMWWGLATMTFGTRGWWLGTLGAGVITWLIVLVSGVPLAEKRLAKKAGWRDYAATTNRFIPGPAKHSKKE